MNLKEKIALNALKRRLDRGAITQAQALEEYKKITGQYPEEYFGPEQEAPETDDQGTGQKKEEADGQPAEANPESSNPDRIDTVRVESKAKKK